MSILLAWVILPLAVRDWLQPAATVTAALVAITGVVVTVVVQRRSSKETIIEVRRSADASAQSANAAETSANAATMSAQAAADGVEIARTNAKSAKTGAEAARKSAEAATKSATAATHNSDAATRSAAAAEKAAEAAGKNAGASERSSQAAERSAHAAQDSVGLNRDTAAGVARRAEADALAKRYQDAANQLGSDSPAVRIAAAHALGRLGDDWPAERQTCLDVLCAYLQMPFQLEEDASEQAIEGEDRVRRTILDVILERFKARATTSWSDLRADFTGCLFGGIQLRDLVFGREVSFADAAFAGECSFDYVEFAQGADFSNAIVIGDLSFNGCSTGSQAIHLDNGLIQDGGEVYVRPGFRSPTLPQLDWMNLQVEGFLYLMPTRCFRTPSTWDLSFFRLGPTGEVHIGGPPSPGQSIEGGLFPTVEARLWYVEEEGIVRLYPWLVKLGVVKYGQSSWDHWSPGARVNQESRTRGAKDYPPDEPPHDETVVLWPRRKR